ncbi:hypothetical protein EW146_g5930 [Bondarzewia mesenterica]|uniref:Large ribosomal subunit protein uL2m n=1 Tax=Bondarzewia mesenterica TaxID=1095465 RepID=A0A4S4LR22_9AGAM|nr:hypothetical protein EW146_g5930 [Bondarzewia mesenterica]
MAAHRYNSPSFVACFWSCASMFSVRSSASLLRSCLRPLSSQKTYASRSNLLARGFATEPTAEQRPTDVNEALARTSTLFKTYKPVTPGIRHLRRPLNPHLYEGRPLRLLTVALRKKGGRNAHGRITVRHRGGGHRRRIRIVDFMRTETGLHDVVRIEYDPNRSAHIALINNRDPNVEGRKKWSYILACEGLRAGHVVESFRMGIPDGLVPGYVDPKRRGGKALSDDVDVGGSTASLTMGVLRARTIRPGNVLPLRLIPTGTIIHAIALSPEGRGMLVRAAGSFGQVIAHDASGKYAQVRLQSGEVRKILEDCCATIGKVSNPLWKNRNLGKAGRSRWLGRRPHVRGVAMNANEHPHGGGRGKSKSNKHPVSIWGWNTKGKRTRKPGPKGPKNSNKMVVRERPRGKEKRSNYAHVSFTSDVPGIFAATVTSREVARRGQARAPSSELARQEIRSMEPAHPLKLFLQHQLASDSNAILHLPYILSGLSSQCFTPSAHLQKWSTRLSSLIHSKDPGARWAGLCLAFQTSMCSKTLMIESAQSWIGAALPLLSKNEPVPNLKSAIRLLLYIFSTTTDVPEFQRQLATPNIPKFSLALLALAETHGDQELKLLVINSLAQVIPLFPTLHRALHAPLTAFTLRELNGSAPKPTNESLLNASSRLYAVLPVTGGKVGAANLWRKSLEDTLAFVWNALLALRTTFPHDVRHRQQQQSNNEDPLVGIPLNIDRLCCGVFALCDLLRQVRFTNPRPVQIPVGAVTQLCFALLSCTNEERREGHIDSTTRAMEEAATPDIWKFGCMLLSCLASREQRLPFLHLLISLLMHTHHVHNPIVPARTVKVLVSVISVLLPSHSDTQPDAIAAASGKGDAVLEALDALQLSLRNPYLAPATHSIVSRVLLSIHLSLPLLAPSQVSQDLTLHPRIVGKIRAMCLEIGAGTSSVMSKSLGLILKIQQDRPTSAATDRDLDFLLHPRAPPLIRPLPHVDSLSLFRAEESNEEIDVREGLGIGVIDQAAPREETSPVLATHYASWEREHSLFGQQTTVPLQEKIFQSTANSTHTVHQRDVPAPDNFITTIGTTQQNVLSSAPPAVPAFTTATTSHNPSAQLSTTAPLLSKMTSASSHPALRPAISAPQPTCVPMPMDDDENDEEMPSIDLGSDSD